MSVEGFPFVFPGSQLVDTWLALLEMTPPEPERNLWVTSSTSTNPSARNASGVSDRMSRLSAAHRGPLRLLLLALD